MASIKKIFAFWKEATLYSFISDKTVSGDVLPHLRIDKDNQRTKHNLRFPGVMIDSQYHPYITKSCLVLKIPAEFTSMIREYSENNFKMGFKTKC